MTGEKETWIEGEPRLSSIPPSLDSGMMASDSLPSPTIARDGPVAIPPLARSGISGSVNRYLEAIQTCTLLLSSLFDEAERGDSFTTRATPEVLSETVWFNDFQPT